MKIRFVILLALVFLAVMISNYEAQPEKTTINTPIALLIAL